MKGKNTKNIYINEENSTCCVKLMRNKTALFLYRERNCPTEAEKNDFTKTRNESIIDFGGQKRSQIQQYFILVL